MNTKSISNLLVVVCCIVMTTACASASSAKKKAQRNSKPAIEATTVSGWGKAENPDGDCRFFVSPDGLLINVPGLPKPHDLAAELGIINAPRVLQAIEGDFTVEVKVEGRFAPGDRSTLPNRIGYNGAGLVVMSDSQNVVCLARAVLQSRGGKPKPYANFEMRADGELARIGMTNEEPLPAKGPVFLRLSRSGHKIFGAVSTDGKEWSQLAPKELPMNWPKKLMVGVVAISTSMEEFNPRFSNLQIAK